jgi:hypothetical protein
MKMTSKFYTGLLALVAVVAFGAIVASASAETTLLAEWLVNGNGLPALTSSEAPGELILENTNTGIVVLCSVREDGSLGPSGESEDTEILTTGGAAITLAAQLLCINDKNCEKPEFSPLGLPWHGLLFLMESGVFLYEIRNMSYELTCTTLGIKSTDTCTFENDTDEVVNKEGGSSEQKGREEPLGNCSIGGEHTGVFEELAGNKLVDLLVNPVLVSSI